MKEEKSIYESKLFIVVCVLLTLVVIGGMFIVFQMMLLSSPNKDEFVDVSNESRQEVNENLTQNVVETPVKTETPKETEVTREVVWNDGLYVEENGNLIIASDVLKDMKSTDVNLENTIHIEPDEVVRKPWDFYGEFITVRGHVAFVQAYPESSELAQGLQANGTVTEITLVAEDGVTLVSFFYKGDFSNVASDTLLSITGLPCGLATVENTLGGSVDSIVIVGINQPEVVVIE